MGFGDWLFGTRYNEATEDGFDLPADHIVKLVAQADHGTCEMFLRKLNGERCRRSRSTTWFGYHVCHSCAEALRAEGKPQIP